MWLRELFRRAPDAPATAERAPERAWAHAPAVQRVTDEPVLVTNPEEFRDGLTTWQNPSLGRPLGHLVSPDAPSGVVHGLANVAVGVRAVPDLPPPARRDGQRAVPVQRAAVEPPPAADPVAPVLAERESAAPVPPAPPASVLTSAPAPDLPVRHLPAVQRTVEATPAPTVMPPAVTGEPPREVVAPVVDVAAPSPTAVVADAVVPDAPRAVEGDGRPEAVAPTLAAMDVPELPGPLPGMRAAPLPAPAANGALPPVAPAASRAGREVAPPAPPAPPAPVAGAGIAREVALPGPSAPPLPSNAVIQRVVRNAATPDRPAPSAPVAVQRATTPPDPMPGGAGPDAARAVTEPAPAARLGLGAPLPPVSPRYGVQPAVQRAADTPERLSPLLGASPAGPGAGSAGPAAAAPNGPPGDRARPAPMVSVQRVPDVQLPEVALVGSRAPAPQAAFAAGPDAPPTDMPDPAFATVVTAPATPEPSFAGSTSVQRAAMAAPVRPRDPAPVPAPPLPVQREMDAAPPEPPPSPEPAAGPPIEPSAPQPVVAAAPDGAANAAGPAGAAGAGGAAGAAGASAADVDALVRRLYDPLARRLRAELRLGRERAGHSLDLRH